MVFRYAQIASLVCNGVYHESVYLPLKRRGQKYKTTTTLLVIFFGVASRYRSK